MTIRLRIKPEAAECVVLEVERQASLKAGEPEQRPVSRDAGAATKREMLVRQAVKRIEEKLLLRCGIIEIRGNFAAGELRTLELTDTP